MMEREHATALANLEIKLIQEQSVTATDIEIQRGGEIDPYTQ
jgi:hypothetical protein